MKAWAILFFSTVLAACATAPVAQRAEHLFNDHLFPAASERISADDVFALSNEMKRYVGMEIAAQLHFKGRQQGLFDALYSKGQLKLEYDSVKTRNASQTFEARSGNCLSLVIMTAAFARELGLTVQYQSVSVDETWSRSGDLYFSSGHVNLSLGKKTSDVRMGYDKSHLLTIDFLPPEDINGHHTRAIGEETIVAMYMNNRAAESLASGRLTDAYWWAREAIRQDPGFLSAYNTLGVIYRRHGNLQEAERALRHVFEREPRSTLVMSNLAQVLDELGRVAESKAMTLKLAQLQPYPPFHFFNLGLAAMQREDFQTAKELFTKEVDRAPYYHEFHFRLATAYFALGEIRQASRHLALAVENSTTHNDHDLYAAKLDRLRSYHPQ